MQTPPTHTPKVVTEILSLEQRRIALIESINLQRAAMTSQLLLIRHNVQPFASVMCTVLAWRRSLFVSAAAAAIATAVVTRLVRAPALTKTVQRVQRGLRWWLIARVVGRIATHLMARRSDTQSLIGNNQPKHHY